MTRFTTAQVSPLSNPATPSPAGPEPWRPAPTAVEMPGLGNNQGLPADLGTEVSQRECGLNSAQENGFFQVVFHHRGSAVSSADGCQ